MVTQSRALSLSFILLVSFIWLALIPIRPARAAITYTVSQEWVRILINKDGSIDIQYNVTLTYMSGSPQGIVTVGMPKEGFQIESVRDLSGADLEYTDISNGGYYGIDVQLKDPIVLNQPYTFIVYAIVPEMVSRDSANLGNVGMLFYPTTFPGASGSIKNIRVAIVLPEGVTSNEVKYPAGMPFDNVFVDGNNLVVYWERSNWRPTQELRVGVSFPEKYVSLGPDVWFYVAIGGAIVAIIGVIVLVLMRFRKATYEKPRIAIEALGAARGLTAAEAGVVLDLKPVRVLTMILFGLLLKRILMVTATDPLLKLQRLQRPEGQATSLRYYEIDYLDALEPDGGLNEMILARTYLGLRDAVDYKLRGYSRADTANYYRSVVDNAWGQVMKAGTPELKGDAIDQNIEWLLADDSFDDKFRVALPPDIIIYPRPGWWWYWRGPYFPPGQTPLPPATSTEAKPIPAQEFANNIVRGLEKAANNTVKNVQEFTNRLVPAPTVTARERPVRSRSSCVCACAHCACACACVSCACACAHGGAR